MGNLNWTHQMRGRQVRGMPDLPSGKETRRYRILRVGERVTTAWRNTFEWTGEAWLWIPSP
jgi:hypothetical protein